MDTLLPLHQMSRAEKFRALDELWNDLYPNEEAMDSPLWHLEIPVSLDEAEKQLRARLSQ